MSELFRTLATHARLTRRFGELLFSFLHDIKIFTAAAYALSLLKISCNVLFGEKKSLHVCAQYYSARTKHTFYNITNQIFLFDRCFRIKSLSLIAKARLQQLAGWKKLSMPGLEAGTYYVLWVTWQDSVRWLYLCWHNIFSSASLVWSGKLYFSPLESTFSKWVFLLLADRHPNDRYKSCAMISLFLTIALLVVERWGLLMLGLVLLALWHHCIMIHTIIYLLRYGRCPKFN